VLTQPSQTVGFTLLVFSLEADSSVRSSTLHARNFGSLTQKVRTAGRACAPLGYECQEVQPYPFPSFLSFTSPLLSVPYVLGLVVSKCSLVLQRSRTDWTPARLPRCCKRCDARNILGKVPLGIIRCIYQEVHENLGISAGLIKSGGFSRSA